MFGENLALAMHRREITQKELAALTGISKSGISQYLSGKQHPRAGKVQKFADALETTAEFLTGETPNDARPALPRFEAFRNVSIEDAARILGKSKNFVRIALQRGVAPFGFAVKISGNKYSYHISPRKLEHYIQGEGVNGYEKQ
jgi:transcriptional regulator with XRE-family HTH domain